MGLLVEDACYEYCAALCNDITDQQHYNNCVNSCIDECREGWQP